MANPLDTILLSKLLCYLCALQMVNSQPSTLGNVTQVLKGGLEPQRTNAAAPVGARTIPLSGLPSRGSALSNGQPSSLAAQGRAVMPLVDDHQSPVLGSPNLAATLDKARFNKIQSQPLGSLGSLAGLAGAPLEVTPLPVVTFRPNVVSNSTAAGAATPARSTVKPPPTTTFAGYLPGSPYPFVLPPPDIPYFGSKWNGPWGYPIGHYQAFRGTGQYITHYSYYPLSYFGSLMAPFAYGVSGKK